MNHIIDELADYIENAPGAKVVVPLAFVVLLGIIGVWSSQFIF